MNKANLETSFALREAYLGLADSASDFNSLQFRPLLATGGKNNGGKELLFPENRHGKGAEPM